MEGWTLTSVAAISSDYTILTGTGINPQGQQEAWYADLSAPLDGFLASRTANSVLYRVDLKTGQQTAIGPTGIANIRALEHVQGALYAVGDQGLFRVDPDTGVADLIGPTNVVLDDLAATPHGVLYGHAATNGNPLYRINLRTGQATQVASLAPYVATSALAGDEQGKLVGWDEGAEWLFAFDPRTSAVSSRGALEGAAYRSLDYGADARLYGWNGAQVVRLDPASKAVDDAVAFTAPAHGFTLISDPSAYWKSGVAATRPFGEAGSWTTGVRPNAYRDAKFALDDAMDVAIGAADAAKSVHVLRGEARFLGTADGRLQISHNLEIDEPLATSLDDAASLTLDPAQGRLAVTVAEQVRVGGRGRGTLQMVAGAHLVAHRVAVGAGANGFGEVRVAGLATLLGDDPDGAAAAYEIGLDGGEGILTVADRGRLQLASPGSQVVVGRGAGSRGRLQIDGAGAQADLAKLSLGVGGAGRLDIRAGGKLVHAANAAPALLAVAEGPQANGSASVEVEGAGSLWSVPQAHVGVDGAAETAVRDGGRLAAAGDLLLGKNASASGKLTAAGRSGGAAAQVQVGGDLTVGAGGRGAVDVVDGAQLTVANNLWVGAQAANAHQNPVAVRGAGSRLEAQRIHIGDAAHGRLDVADGAVVQAANFVVAQQAGSRGSVAVDGPGSRLVANALGVSTFGEAALEVVRGGRVDAHWRLWVGFADQGVSDVRVSGAGSQLVVGAGTQANPALLVGGEPTFQGGKGQLAIDAGASLAAFGQILVGPNAASDGLLVVRGPGTSADFTRDDAVQTPASIGDRGRGTLQVLDGALLRSEQALVGRYAGAAGRATVEGLQSLWTTRTLVVGDAGHGTLEVGGGARLGTELDAAVAAQAAAVGRVAVGAAAGAATAWDLGGSLLVGRNAASDGGAGVVEIGPAGRLAVGGALRLGSRGRVVLDGGQLAVRDLQRLPGGSFEFVAGEMRFGPAPGGERLLDEAALATLLGPRSRLDVGQKLAFADPVTLTGRLELAGGELSVPSFNLLPVAQSAANLDWRGGTLAITAGDLLVGPEGPFGERLYLSERHLLEVGGGLVAEGQLNLLGGSVNFVAPSVVNASGAINAINATLNFDLGLTVFGRLNLIDSQIEGDVQVASGAVQFAGTNEFGSDLQFGPADVLAVELRSLAPGGYDRLAVQGDAVLGGSLALRARSGFALAPGEAVEIVSIGGQASGQFAGLAEGALVGKLGGTDLFITYLGGDGNDVALFAAQAGPDVNRDGVVDGRDLLAWEAAFGTGAAGDANADGVTDGRDLLAWQRGFGQATAAPAIGAPVPEPATAVLLLAALAIGRLRRDGWRATCAAGESV